MGSGEEAEFAGFTRDGLFAEQNQLWEGYTATFEGRPGGRSFGTSGSPAVFRSHFKTSSGAANRLTVADKTTLSRFDTYALPIYQGAIARIYRVTNGVMGVVRESEITGGKIGRWLWLQPNGTRILDSLTYTHVLPDFARPNVPYYYRVAAVDGSGVAGSWSTPVAFTPVSMTGTPSGTVNTTSTITKTGTGGALAAPTGFAANAGAIAREAVLTWDAVSGASGYIVEFSYYDPAEIDETAPYLDLASHAEPILAGDLVVFSKQYLTIDDDHFCHRVYNADSGVRLTPAGMLFGKSAQYKRDGNSWEYIAYSGDKPALAYSNHFLRRTAAAGNTTKFQFYWHGGSGQTFYRVLQAGVTYRLRVVMRASEATTLTFTTGSSNVTGTTFSVGTTFAEYTHDMTASATLGGTQPYDWGLQFTAGASPLNVDVAFFEIEEVGISANPMAISPPAENSFLRDHRYTRNGMNHAAMADILATGFKVFHDACVLNNCKPWLQFEWITPKEDILNLVAFLAAPNTESHPMVTLRQEMGITDPWVDTFDEIKFENGNEAWNSLAFFQTIPSMIDSATAVGYGTGNVAGLMWQMTSDWMKESPYWSALSAKLVQHAGGWSGNSFGEAAYQYFPDAKEVSIAAYNGGWDNGTSLVSESGLSFSATLAFPIVTHKPLAAGRVAALKSTCTNLGRDYGTDIRYTIYEGGPGYQLNGLNGATVTAAQVIEQEIVMKSRAAAAATVDSMLVHAQQDFKGYNFFTVGVGDYWRSHSEPTNSGEEYMTHALVRIIHEQMAPAKVYGAPTAEFGAITVTQRNGTTTGINQIGAYQLRNLADPSKRMIVLINRALDPSQLETDDPLYSATPSGSKLFTVETTWSSATSLKAWTAGIGPYREHNRYPVGQRRDASGGLVADSLCVSFNYAPTTFTVPSDLSAITIDDSVGATADGLPAGNCLILLFEGVT